MTKRPKRTPRKRRFSPGWRLTRAIQLGIEPFASNVERAEKKLVARALAAKTTRGAFDEAVRYFFLSSSPGAKDPRLLEKFFSFSESEQARNVFALEWFYEDARARRAMMDLATKSSRTEFAWFALSLRRVGGRGARKLLRARLDEFRDFLDHSHPKKISRDDVEAGNVTAECLLGLDPDALAAANMLVRLYRDRARYGKDSNAIPFLRDAFMWHSTSYTRAMVRVREALRELLDPNTDEEDFAMAIIALGTIDPLRTRARAEATLFSKDGIVRMLVAQWLSSHSPGSAPLLLRYLVQYPGDHTVMPIAQRLGTAVSNELRCTLAEHQLRQEWPHDRLSAAQYVRETPGLRALAIARRALRSEPDPLIAQVLKQLKSP